MLLNFNDIQNYPVYTVYKTTNIVNGSFYIGYHKSYCLNDEYLGSGIRLARSIKKYGWENFIKETLFVFDDSEEAFAKEREVIALYRSIDPLCINVATGGKGGRGKGFKHTAKSCEKMSLARKGIPKSLETRLKMSLAALKQKRKMSQEAKDKISNANRGHICSAEQKLAVSKALTGRVISEETRAKLRSSQIGKLVSEETRAKQKAHIRSSEHCANISKANKGRVLSTERKAAISAANMGTHRSEETKAKMSASAKLARQRRKEIALLPPKN